MAAMANPPTAVAGEKGPSSMTELWVGPTERNPKVDALFKEFRGLPPDTDRNLIADLIPLARPDAKKPQPIVTKAMAICRWVTGSKSCTDLDWLDNEERVNSFFTQRIAANGDGSKRQHADALRALYLSHDKRDAARLQRYFLAYKTYQQREKAPGAGSKASEEQLKNTPTMAEITLAKEQADTQGKAFVALAAKVQGRCQNMMITPCVRQLGGTLVHYETDADGFAQPVEHVEADGFPININAYIVPEDARLPPVYVQNVYKNSQVFGKKVAIIDPETHALVMAWLEESPNTAALFLDTTGQPVHSSANGPSDTVAGLCRRIFQSVCGKAVTPGLIRRACADTKEMREAVTYVMEGADVRNHGLLMEMASGHYAFKGPASN